MADTKEEQQSKETHLPLYLFTYNCNKQVIESNTFKTRVTESLPDDPSLLYVFALQEFCSILDGSFRASANQQLISYNETIQVMLFEKYGMDCFQTIAMNHVGSIGLIIISPFAPKFSNIRTATSSVGYGYSSMKGGVGIRLKYSQDNMKSVELSFAGVHLNAFEGEYYYLQRNQNLLTIIRSLEFGDGYGLIKPNNHIFVLGDLNYRTTQDYKKTSVVAQNLLALADQHSTADREYVYQLFSQYDELYKGLKNGEVLLGFSEAKIEFQPTYKYYINTGIYNSKRCPSWCDRILFLSTYEDEEHLHLLRTTLIHSLPVIDRYDSINSLLLSDHRPVFLRISVPFKPPKLIISRMSGCLEIVSTGLSQQSRFLILGQLEEIDHENYIESGPTSIYLKPTKFDFFINRVVTQFMDNVIGYGLWLGTTIEGRMTLLILALLIAALWYLL
ncbi:Phosphatidylinositol 4,5-bisphosphate 5-phosphatase INP54 [Candida viswanathii]|uniref:Phosphatidylinositol 4,5-bisphosphate 5-phosphatase INP54 n=1 Tax=Candida viswanathii TaxID=5486 RepID=A0A367YHN0_9ASCO|nr:Phosphatidylinositol 4,5-bisphosphate 5-phosphatase INP54 [Candida viswanathii]